MILPKPFFRLAALFNYAIIYLITEDEFTERT